MSAKEDIPDVGKDCGKDPRKMTAAELEALGHQPMSPGKALRLRCLDCCAGSPAEVRMCSAVACPSWPFRMGKNPWRKVRQASDAQKASLKARLDNIRQKQGM